MKNFIKDHWFGILMCIFFGLYLIIFAISIIKPQYFEACSGVLHGTLIDCKQSIVCIIKAFIKNLSCEINTLL